MSGKGIVIEVNKNRVIIMTEQCEFKEITLQKPVQAGDLIDYVEEDVNYKKNNLKAAAVVASLLVFCLLAFSIHHYISLGEVYACIYFDINPSFEIRIDKNDQVVGVQAFNDDGKELLSQSQLLGIKLSNIIPAIMKQCREKTYLDSETSNHIAISIYFTGNTVDRTLLEKLNNKVKAELEGNDLSARVYYFVIDKETRDQARLKNVSPTRLLLWKEAQKEGYPYDMNEGKILKNTKIEKIASRVAEKIVESGRYRTQTKSLPESPVINKIDQGLQSTGSQSMVKSDPNNKEGKDQTQLDKSSSQEKYGSNRNEDKNSIDIPVNITNPSKLNTDIKLNEQASEKTDAESAGVNSKDDKSHSEFTPADHFNNNTPGENDINKSMNYNDATQKTDGDGSSSSESTNINTNKNTDNSSSGSSLSGGSGGKR